MQACPDHPLICVHLHQGGPTFQPHWPFCRGLGTCILPCLGLCVSVFSHGSIPSLHYYWVSAHHLCSLPGITSCICFSLRSLSSLSCPPDVRCLLYCQISTPGPGKPVNTHLAIDILSRPPAPYSAKNALTPTKGDIYLLKTDEITTNHLPGISINRSANTWDAGMDTSLPTVQSSSTCTHQSVRFLFSR